MLERDLRKKDLMVICDFPLENEEKRGEAFVAASSIAMKDALLQASMTECAKFEKKFHINSASTCYTYLSLTRPSDDDKDWENSIVTKKNIPEGLESDYIQITHLKDVYVTTAVHTSFVNLLRQIKEVQPKFVVIGGKWAFMLLCSLFEEPSKQLATIGNTKTTPKVKRMFGVLNKYRSSLLTFNEQLQLPIIPIVPILTPAYHFLVKDKSYLIKRDYAKIAHLFNKTMHNFDVFTNNRNTLLGLSNTEVFEYLNNLLTLLDSGPMRVAFDVETRQGQIDCIGIAYKETESFTIPFSEMYEEINTDPTLVCSFIKDKKEYNEIAPIGAVLTRYRHYWNLDDQTAICHLLWQIMLHPNCKHVGQNYNYDCQYYFHRYKLGIFSDCDTMILHHVLHNTLPKDLATLASVYCMDYVYWKDEIDVQDNITRWKYNGKDCMYTLTVANLLIRILQRYPEHLKDFYYFQQYKVVPLVVKIMNRGVKVELEQKEMLRVQFEQLLRICEEKLNYVFMEEVNLKSTPQVKRAFKDLLGIKPIVNRKTKTESFGSDAMLVYLEEYPEWRTILTLFLEYKSIGVFTRTFLNAKVDDDGRMRCDYNPAGTKTYRFASRKNVFGNGLNLANVPAKGKIDLRISTQEFIEEESSTKTLTSDSSPIIEVASPDDSFYEGSLQLPNCKDIFIPDAEDLYFFDADYSAIDLHFVVWESGCEFLKQIIRNGGDVYSFLASEYYQREITKSDEERQTFKAVCHGTNYLGKAKTLAAKAGLSIKAVNNIITMYFKKAPEILEWHRYLESFARKNGYIENCFGARNEVFDFTDEMWLNKLVAWQPQSSAAILVNKAINRLETTEPLLDTNYPIVTKLQTHDSISGLHHADDVTAIARIIAYMEMPIAFKANELRSKSDTVIIPAEVKHSLKSYGSCKKVDKNGPFAVSNHLEAQKELRLRLNTMDANGMFSGKDKVWY